MPKFIIGYSEKLDKLMEYPSQAEAEEDGCADWLVIEADNQKEALDHDNYEAKFLEWQKSFECQDKNIKSDNKVLVSELDMVSILEVARLACASIPDTIVDEMDISDERFTEIRNKVQEMLDFIPKP
jgi:hypothetical protein